MIVSLLAAEPGEENDRDGFRFRGRAVGDALGAELLGCALYDIPPGEQLWPYHYHLGNEEWAVVVAGTPTVRTPEGQRELRPGDVVAFPEGEGGAHTFLNHSEEDARVALFSTLNRQTLPVYLDSGKVGAMGKCFRLDDAVGYWAGEGPG
ncbi:MAG TPA: cupin domain-containing protein [Gaiellaceae bacterium]|nr:cupin domain-containing protein [Gaiellaceae bacterium]